MENVRYSNSPLAQVVAQIRFPNLLEISNIEPVLFQQKIRKDYPLYSKAFEKQRQFAIDNQNKSISKLLDMDIVNHQFSNTEGNWYVNLTNTFLSISTSKYESYADFLDKFMLVVNEFYQIYQPSFYTRIGLRYIDAFSKKRYNKERKDWHDLIESWALGLLSHQEFGAKVTGLQNVAEMNIGEGYGAKIITSLGYVNNDFSEKQFILDTDAFLNKNSDPNELLTILNKLHEYSYNVFESVVRDELREVMK